MAGGFDGAADFLGVGSALLAFVWALDHLKIGVHFFGPMRYGCQFVVWVLWRFRKIAEVIALTTYSAMHE